MVNIHVKQNKKKTGVKKKKIGVVSKLTCTQEEHLIVAVGSSHLVHSDGGELIVHVGPDHQGALVHRIHSVVHSGMVPHEVDDLVGVVFRGLHVGGKSPSRTLTKMDDEDQF